MVGNKREPSKDIPDVEPSAPAGGGLALQPSDLLPGDVLVFRPRSPNVIQRAISSATGSPYAHAAIYMGAGFIAESGAPFGVTKSVLQDSVQGSQCIAVLRSQLGFSGDRPRRLNEFVAAVLERKKFYNFIAVASFSKRSAEYSSNHLEFIRDNYGKVTSREEFVEQSFFCSAPVQRRRSPPEPAS